MALGALAFAALMGACGGSSGVQIGDSTSPTDPAPSGNGSSGSPAAGSGGSSSNATSMDAGGGSSSPDASTKSDDAGDTQPMPKPAKTPDVDSIPWQTGTAVGAGIASKDTQNPAGNGVFIAYAAFDVTLASAEAWATEVYRDSLEARGIRYVFAVQGPADIAYSQREIGNSKIAGALLPLVTGNKVPVVVLAHSAGTLVAHELFGELQATLDPKGVAAARIVYFNLDGQGDGLDTDTVAYLRRAYFVGAHAGNTGTSSTNASAMQSLGATYANAGGYVEIDASASGCNAGGLGCVHETLVTTKPHDPNNADLVDDYTDFVGRPVSHAYVDQKAAEAGL